MVSLTEIVACSAVTERTPTLMSTGAVESPLTVTAGGVENRPTGNCTVSVLNPSVWFVTVIVTVPAAIFGIPDMVPSGLNVNGPQCPDPSPLTSNLSFVDFSVAGSAFGNEFVVGGANDGTPTGTGTAVASAATVDLAQVVPP